MGGFIHCSDKFGIFSSIAQKDSHGVFSVPIFPKLSSVSLHLLSTMSRTSSLTSRTLFLSTYIHYCCCFHLLIVFVTKLSSTSSYNLFCSWHCFNNISSVPVSIYLSNIVLFCTSNSRLIIVCIASISVYSCFQHNLFHKNARV